jgi:hypothetical protein
MRRIVLGQSPRAGNAGVEEIVFHQNVPAGTETIALLQRWPRETVTIREIAGALLRPPSEITQVFELLGLQLAAAYKVADILEANRRYEESISERP